MEAEKIINHIAGWMRDYLTQSGARGFIVGISGGIDSAVTSAIAARTGHPVLLLELPIHQHRSQVNRGQEHIRQLCERYSLVSTAKVELSSVFDQLVNALPMVPGDVMEMALVNSRARLRMTALYYFAGLHNYLVAGTGNKIEDFGIGFFTKYGDGGVDISPIADILKTEVYALGQAMGIVDSIMKAPPTDGLWGDDRTDEQQIGADYRELEWAMNFEQIGTPLTGLSQRQSEVLEIYRRRHEKNLHKILPVPVCRIPDEWR